MTQPLAFGRSLGGRAGVYPGVPVKAENGQIIIARGAKDEKLV